MLRKILLPCAVAALAALAVGCEHVVALPPRITVAQIQPSGRPAKSPDCKMPVLRSEPLTKFTQIAIIEGLANVFASESDVMPLVKKKACEVGADAIIVKESRSQTSENMTGYYINAVAILYGTGTGAVAAKDAPAAAAAGAPAHR